MYAILSECNKESNKAKGVNISIDLSEYKDILFTGKTIRHRKKRIQSKKHKIGTYEINKISLSSFDDKRFVLDDGIHMLTYFHKDLRCKKMIKKVLIEKWGMKITAYG